MQDLNDLIPADSGWELIAARGINSRGQIVGFGYHGNEGRAYLLTPNMSAVPEPSMFVQLGTLAATSLLGVAIRRRRA